MTSTFEFVSRLHELDVKMSVEGDRLFCDAPEGVLTADLRGEIALRKQELLDFLTKTSRLPQAMAAPDQRYAPFPLTDVQQAYWLGRSGAFVLGNVAAHVYF